MTIYIKRIKSLPFILILNGCASKTIDLSAINLTSPKMSQYVQEQTLAAGAEKIKYAIRIVLVYE